MNNSTPYYTPAVVGRHLARSYSNKLRFNAETAQFEELQGQWRPIDDVSFARYVHDSINVLLWHASNVGRDAQEELHAMSQSDVALYEIRNTAAEMLSTAPQADAEEAE